MFFTENIAEKFKKLLFALKEAGIKDMEIDYENFKVFITAGNEENNPNISVFLSRKNIVVRDKSKPKDVDGYEVVLNPSKFDYAAKSVQLKISVMPSSEELVRTSSF